MSLSGRLGGVARKLGGFGGSVLLNGSISIAVVPIVIASVGAGLWAGIAIAQAIGSFLCVVVSFGWAVTGPAAVAGLAGSERGEYFRDSLSSRLWLAVGTAPVLVVLVLLLAPGDRGADLLAAAALVLPALGASWFFVGEGDPRRLLLCDTLPRATGTACGAVLLLTTHAPLEVFAAGQAIGATASVVLGSRSVLRRFGGPLRFALRSDLHRLRSQSHGMVTAVTAALYVNLPVIIAGVIVPQHAAVYALVDKLQKLALTALGPVFQVSQGAVGGVASEFRPARARTVSRIALLVGGLVTIGFSTLGPLGSRVLSNGAVDPPFPLLVALGVALGAISVSAIVGLSCLTALGAVRAVAASTVLGAVVGIPAIVAAGALFGIVGIGVAAAVSELVVTVFQLVVLHRRIGASLRSDAVPPLLGSPSF